MKKVTSLLSALMFALVSVLMGCNNNDDDNNAAAAALQGNWKLVQISGGISGSVQNVTPGTVVWNFNETDTRFIVTNNAPAGSASGLATGTYEYTQQAEQGLCDNFINAVADDYIISLGCPTVSSDTLTLNNGYADGDIFTFIR